MSRSPCASYLRPFDRNTTKTHLVLGVVVPNVGLKGVFAFLVLFSFRFWSLSLCAFHHSIVYHAIPHFPQLTSLSDDEIERFEDASLEFIGLDLSFHGADTYADVTTRRTAAAHVLQLFMSSGFEAEATEIVGQHSYQHSFSRVMTRSC